MWRAAFVLGIVGSPAVLARPAAALVPHEDVAPPPEPPPIDRLEALPEEAPTLWTTRPLALEAHASLGGPFGLLGAAADLSPSTGFSVTLGAGYASAAGALQVGAQLRLRLLLTRNLAVGAEGGIAVGGYEERFDCANESCPPDWSWERAVWGSTGLMLEGRNESGWTLRWSFGASAILNVVDGTCRRCDASDEPGVWVTTVPYTAVAVGRSFEL